MNTTELYEFFRGVVDDVEEPYLWSDAEVFTYMDSAQKMFCRLYGGIPDVQSDATVVDVVTGEKYADLHPSVLYIQSARLVSTGQLLSVVNATQHIQLDTDYGRWLSQPNPDTTGPIKAMIIGEQEDIARWVYVPEADDTVELTIRRLPLKSLTGLEQTLEIPERHHEYLALWMQHRSFLKNDAETFDRGRSNQTRDDFVAYCQEARKEWDRKKYVPRTVMYGGI